MKKLMTICILLAATITVKAQQMSFDETVKYIQQKVECCSVNYDDGTARYSKIDITKNGQIKFIRTDGESMTFNLFDLNQRGSCECGISNDVTYVEFWYEENRCKRVKLTTIPEAERVTKAFLHLLALCTKTKDPFDK